jgi:transposase
MKERCSSRHPAETVAGLKPERVDSSPVTGVSGRISEYLTCGNKHKKGKMLKYTINYDGIYGSFAGVHTEEKYASESLALPENVKEHCKKSRDHSSVYITDRGQSSTEAFREMSSTEDLRFVGRLMENRKLHIVKEFDLTFKRFRDGRLIQDAIVQLYGSEHVTTKNGNTVRKLVLREEKYRVIRFRAEGKKEDILLITNIFNLPAETVAHMYRRRWDIEVFFRFLKQELSFSHFISLNRNGIEVMLYMTLITAMLIMIYRKENGIGFRTAKRRILIELQELTLAAVAVISGGDPKRIDLWSP